MNRYILLTIKKTFLFIVMSALFSSCIVDPVERQEVGFRSGKTAFSYVEELLNFYLENLNRMMILEDYLNNPSDNTDYKFVETEDNIWQIQNGNYILITIDTKGKSLNETGSQWICLNSDQKDIVFENIGKGKWNLKSEERQTSYFHSNIDMNIIAMDFENLSGPKSISACRFGIIGNLDLRTYSYSYNYTTEETILYLDDYVVSMDLEKPITLSNMGYGYQIIDGDFDITITNTADNQEKKASVTAEQTSSSSRYVTILYRDEVSTINR